jgi:hypothetical protein
MFGFLWVDGTIGVLVGNAGGAIRRAAGRLIRAGIP